MKVSAFSTVSAITANASKLKVQVHSIVVLSILQHYARREEADERVIGLLLGTFDDESGLLNVERSFPVKHSDRGEQVWLDMDSLNMFYDIHIKSFPKDLILGWYATGEMQSESLALQDYFCELLKESGNRTPIHATLNPLSFELKTYLSKAEERKEEEETAVEFFEISNQVVIHKEEKGAFWYVKNASDDDRIIKSASPLDRYQQITKEMAENLTKVVDYLEKVKSGEITADEAIVAEISTLLGTVPAMQKDEIHSRIQQETAELNLLEKSVEALVAE